MTDQLIFPREFAVDLVWSALQALLANQLGEDVDVDCIGERDFDEEGELTVELPAARVLFLGEAAQKFENQNQNYDVQQAFAVLCADEDLGPDPHDQRLKSVRLAGAVKHVLTGARLPLADGTKSEPILYVKTEPLPVGGMRMAYIVEFSIGGIAQFAAPNAWPALPYDVDDQEAA